MKKNALIPVSLLAASFLTACSNTETQELTNNGVQAGGTTTFSAAVATKPTAAVTSIDDAKTSLSPLTTIVYDKATPKSDFFWTSGDVLWVKNGGSYAKSAPLSLSEKASSADFQFSDTYTDASYPVYYTGSSTTGSSVTIKASQTQASKDDASHIGTDGDCGYALATKSGNKYTFQLSHKASYLVFAPYYSAQNLDGVKIKKIKVTANENVAGTYNWNRSNSLDVTAPTAASKSIELNITDGLTIPQTKTTDNNVVMVIAPGTYTGLTVTYTLEGGATTEQTVTFNDTKTVSEGKYTMVAQDLSSISTLPVVENLVSNTTDTQTFAPTANQLSWYVKLGDARFESNVVYYDVAGKKLAQHDGLWIKKLANIKAENPTEDVDNTSAWGGDWNTTQVSADDRDRYQGGSINAATLTDKSGFFFVPLTTNGYGFYWVASSTRYSNGVQMYLIYRTDGTIATYAQTSAVAASAQSFK